jgi:hypothetical protein
VTTVGLRITFPDCGRQRSFSIGWIESPAAGLQGPTPSLLHQLRIHKHGACHGCVGA